MEKSKIIAGNKIKNIDHPNKNTVISRTKEVSIRSLRGKGKKMWSTVDIEQYIKTERSGWGN